MYYFCYVLLVLKVLTFQRNLLPSTYTLRWQVSLKQWCLSGSLHALHSRRLRLNVAAFCMLLAFMQTVCYLLWNKLFFFRFGLCDFLRHGDRVVISPNRNLSIVSDSLGRVILIDNLKGLAIRMWKGMWYCNISFR